MLGKYLVAAEVYGEYTTEAKTEAARTGRTVGWEEWITRKLIGTKFEPVVKRV